jgi:NADPH-dependent 2,4-dienoyl-CoA reductase/sulfur reductase-like enzyme/rhodanese-related sulfurtransferase
MMRLSTPLHSLKRNHDAPGRPPDRAGRLGVEARKEKKAGEMKVIIVGGVAGGASCAARLRRLDERAEILMVERGPYVSYANCGLPYRVGGVIEHESSLLVANEKVFREHFAVDCRTRCEAIGVSAADKTVELRDLATGEVTTESYDKLVLSPGATSVRPPLPGIDLPGIFQVRTVPDAREIREWIERGTSFLAGMERYSGFQTVRPPMRAVVVGGGFIGLEMAENLVRRGFDVTVVEMLDQVLSPLDPEYGRVVKDSLELHGVHVALDDGVDRFERSEEGSLEVWTRSGASYPADLVILALGVRPDTTLAKMAGIEIGERGGIRVDEHMRTSDPDIFAVGDVVEVRDFVTGQWSLIALAGPANRQARIAADVIAGRDSRFRGTQGTSIVELFGAAVAWTGASEKTLNALGDTDFEKIYIYPNSHAGYYPGAKPIAMKLIFRKSDGRVLGAQAVGEDGVDKRIDHIALAIQMGATVFDLEQVELCYSPPFGSAKDPINFAGMVAAGVLRGDMPLRHWDATEDALLLDVREKAELAVEHVPEAVNIPIGELRSRLDELPRDREILVICRSGQRAYSATRCLLQNGFDARVISGGMLSHAILSRT